jgi:hypothetical protein
MDPCLPEQPPRKRQARAGDGGLVQGEDDATEEEGEAAAFSAAMAPRPAEAEAEEQEDGGGGGGGGGSDSDDDCIVEQVVTATQREAAARAAAVDLESLSSPPLAPTANPLTGRSGGVSAIDLTGDDEPPPPLPGAALSLGAGELQGLRHEFEVVARGYLTRSMEHDVTGMRAAIAAARSRTDLPQRPSTSDGSEVAAQGRRALKRERREDISPCTASARTAGAAAPVPLHVRRVLQLDTQAAVTDARRARADFYLQTLQRSLSKQPELFLLFTGILEEHDKGQVTIAGMLERVKRILLVEADPPRKDLLLRLNMFVGKGNCAVLDIAELLDLVDMGIAQRAASFDSCCCA